MLQVLMLSLYGSKGRIIQAHMCPESNRLQVRYSEFFDFRNHTKYWLDLSVRWFLNEPLAEPLPQSEVTHSELRDEPQDLGEAVVDDLPKSESGIPDSPHRTAPKYRDTPHTPQKTIPRPLFSRRCNAKESILEQTHASPRILLSA
jgi:hypothetical protein